MSVLSIAGFDPGGGAGVLADIKTFAAHGVDGCAIVTAITAQNARAVNRIDAVDATLVRAQLETLLGDVEISAVKIGMLGSTAIVRVVAECVRKHALPCVVIDPVLRASAGASLLDDDALDVLRRELFPIAGLITPNAMEVAALLDASAPRTIREMCDAASELLRFGADWVLVKGGHIDLGNDCVDLLCGHDEVHELRVPRVDGAELHGTGCMLSSAIAARLAQGASIVDACVDAQRYVARKMSPLSAARDHKAPVRMTP